MRSINKQNINIQPQGYIDQLVYQPQFRIESSIQPNGKANKRYSELPNDISLKKNISAKNSSRITNNEVKCYYRQKHAHSKSPKIIVGTNQRSTQYQALQMILTKKNDTLQEQNQFLKDQIKKLYERQAQFKFSLRNYKSQIKLLQMENQIYLQRYHQLKIYVTQVVQRLSINYDYTNNNQEKFLIDNYSKDLVNKLKQQLHATNFYDKNINQKDNTKKNSQNNQKNQNNNEYLCIKVQKQKSPTMRPRNDASQRHNPNILSSSSSNNLSRSQHKHPSENLLQQTSQTQNTNSINQQIDDLTDQSQALVYQLRKGQNKEVRNQIVRITKKIRELKQEQQQKQYKRNTKIDSQ